MGDRGEVLIAGVHLHCCPPKLGHIAAVWS